MFEQYKVEERGNVTILHLKGQFIGGNETDDLRAKLTEISQKEKNQLVLDLDKVTYLNSTALGVLISAHANFTKRGGKIVLANVGKSIENIFIITKLTLVFTIFSTLNEAIQHFTENPAQ
ncbi:MAG: STAS domain-containing protein [Bacteroidota bacterium]